jgi:hypothetical protein
MKRKQLKNQTIRRATIKIDEIREVFKCEGGYEYKTKMYCADIRTGYGGGVAFCEKNYKTLWKRIKEEWQI